MSTVRVLLGALSEPLSNAVTEAIRRRVDIEVVGVAIRPTALLVAAGTLEPDVVVVPAEGDDPPGIATHLLDQYPRIAVLAVTEDGRHAALYALRPHVASVLTGSADDLAEAIRTAAARDND